MSAEQNQDQVWPTVGFHMFAGTTKLPENMNALQTTTHAMRGRLPVSDHPTRVGSLDVQSLTIHGCYSTSSVFSPKEHIRERAFDLLLEHLQMTSEYTAVRKYLVIHITNGRVWDSRWEEVARYCIDHEITLLFEHVASRNNVHSIEQWQKFISDVTTASGSDDWFGICVDTAHAHAGGTDMREGGLMRYLRDLASVGIVPPVLHLNGNLHMLNSGIDQHTVYGEKAPEVIASKCKSDIKAGHRDGNNFSSDLTLTFDDFDLREIGQFCRYNHIDIIVEYKGNAYSDENLEIIRSIIDEICHCDASAGLDK